MYIPQQCLKCLRSYSFTAAGFALYVYTIRHTINKIYLVRVVMNCLVK